MFVFGLVALFGAIASMTPLADAKLDVALEEFSCSVSGVDGGVEISWNQVRGLESVSYKVDVPGGGSAYHTARVSPVVVPVPADARTSVAMSPVFDGGKEQTRRPCGMARAVAGTGIVEVSCTLERTGATIHASWDEIPGVASYGLKIDLDGVEFSTYRRTTSTKLFLDVEDEQGVSIGVAPVFADGTTSPRIVCEEGSA